jgi:serine/threonine-protein kinase ULK4
MLASLIHLLDHGNGVTRGKAALSLMLIIKFNINTLIQLSEEPLHFFLVIDKVIRD